MAADPRNLARLTRLLAEMRQEVDALERLHANLGRAHVDGGKPVISAR